jgi:hypothetical protein
MARDIRDLDDFELGKLMDSLGDAVENELIRRDHQPVPYIVLLLSDNPLGQFVTNCAEKATVVAWLRETADVMERNEDVAR